MVILAMFSILCGNAEVVKLSLSFIQQNPSNQKNTRNANGQERRLSKAVDSEGYLYVHPFRLCHLKRIIKNGRCRALSGRIGENRF